MVVTTDTPDKMCEAHERYKLQATFVSDVDERCARAYNVVWRPRLFLLDSEGEVRYVQPDHVFDTHKAMRQLEQTVIGMEPSRGSRRVASWQPIVLPKE